MAELAVAAAIMTGLALFFATVLATAHRFLKVEEDPRVDRAEEMLPGTNCGACGEPGCRGLAEKLVGGGAAPAQCSVMSEDDRQRLAGFLGVAAGEAQKRVARLRCAGSQGLVADRASYQGERSCRAAVLVNRSWRACEWGCLGLADCERACTFDAIRMNVGGLPQVDVDGCTACGDCVDVCPLDLFTIQPLEQSLFVQCNTPLAGEAARSRCAVACDACGRCAADAPQVIEMVKNLPVIHYDRGRTPAVAATYRCPTGAITWLTGEQFAAPALEAGAAEEVRRA